MEENDAATWQVAPKPAPRIVTVGIAEGDFAGWRAEVMVDFPASTIQEVRSGDLDKILALCERIIVRHNFPDRDGHHAERIADVDPWTGVVAILNQALSALDALPKR